MINEILEDCKEFVTRFVDDLVVHSSTLEEHMEHITIILSKLGNAGITLKRIKC